MASARDRAVEIHGGGPAEAEMVDAIIAAAVEAVMTKLGTVERTVLHLDGIATLPDGSHVFLPSGTEVRRAEGAPPRTLSPLLDRGRDYAVGLARAGRDADAALVSALCDAASIPAEGAVEREEVAMILADSAVIIARSSLMRAAALLRGGVPGLSDEHRANLRELRKAVRQPAHVRALSAAIGEGGPK
jgi:hypothetical protein